MAGVALGFGEVFGTGPVIDNCADEEKDIESQWMATSLERRRVKEGNQWRYIPDMRGTTRPENLSPLRSCLNDRASDVK